jgi:hypothetical protein
VLLGTGDDLIGARDIKRGLQMLLNVKTTSQNERVDGDQVPVSLGTLRLQKPEDGADTEELDTDTFTAEEIQQARAIGFGGTCINSS